MKTQYKLQLRESENRLVVYSLTWGAKLVPGIDLHRGPHTPEFVELLGLFDLITEHDDYARVNCANSFAELRGLIRRKEDRTYARFNIGGRLTVDQHTTRGGIMTITGIVEWSPETIASKALANAVAELEPLPCMKSSCDGAHCGLGDWYPKIEAGIAAALAEGKPFTTGWYCSKKEIASACLSGDGTTLSIEVSVSNDFDADGMGRTTIPWTTDLEVVRKAVHVAWGRAETDQKANDVVTMVIIGHTGKKKGTRKDWIETYLIDNGSGLELPPGDNYHCWGWDSTDPDTGVYEGELTEEDRTELESKILSNDLPYTTKNRKWTATWGDEN